MCFELYFVGYDGGLCFFFFIYGVFRVICMCVVLGDVGEGVIGDLVVFYEDNYKDMLKYFYFYWMVLFEKVVFFIKILFMLVYNYLKYLEIFLGFI